MHIIFDLHFCDALHFGLDYGVQRRVLRFKNEKREDPSLFVLRAVLTKAYKQNKPAFCNHESGDIDHTA